MTSAPVDRVLRARDLLGIPVVTLGGDDVAEVRDVVYDSERGALLGFTLNKRAWFGGQLAELLPDDSVYAIGKDAVMIEDLRGARAGKRGTRPGRSCRSPTQRGGRVSTHRKRDESR